MIAIRRAVKADAERIGPRLRPGDAAEIAALRDDDPAAVVAQSIAISDRAWTADIDGIPEIVFGAAVHDEGFAVGWLLATPAMERHRTAIASKSLVWRNRLLRRYPVLRNYVHAENRASLAWLAWLGARIGDPVSYGRKGELFRLFELRRHDV